MHSVPTQTNLRTIKKLEDGKRIIGLELVKDIPDPQNQHMPFQETHSMEGILQEERKYLHRLPVWSTGVHTPYV
jgi:hypothetical protein